jgi:purine-binding chemotaxis protein CheW
MTDKSDIGGSEKSLLGIIDLRGQAVPVFDLATALDIPSEVRDDRDMVVVIQEEDTLYGWRVSGVEEVFTAPEDSIAPAPYGGAASQIINHQDKLIPVLEDFSPPMVAQ